LRGVIQGVVDNVKVGARGGFGMVVFEDSNAERGEGDDIVSGLIGGGEEEFTFEVCEVVEEKLAGREKERREEVIDFDGREGTVLVEEVEDEPTVHREPCALASGFLLSAKVTNKIRGIFCGVFTHGEDVL
jgi:hypothetical protein